MDGTRVANDYSSEVTASSRSALVELYTILGRYNALAKAPEDRYPDAAAMTRDLVASYQASPRLAPRRSAAKRGASAASGA